MVVVVLLTEVVEWSGGGHVVTPCRRCRRWRWWSGGRGRVVNAGGGVVGHRRIIDAGWGCHRVVASSMQEVWWWWWVVNTAGGGGHH